MERVIQKQLVTWRDAPHRKPLIVRGARQVGKSYLIEKFAKESYSKHLIINFEQQRQYCKSFDDLDPKLILADLGLRSGQKVVPGETLLFLDEVQYCPNALLALRYFKEKMPELHVIAAGSLLEFTLKAGEFRMPVGRVQSLYMRPLSFYEFLLALEDNVLLDYCEQLELTDAQNLTAHERLLERLRQYWILGGMPEVVQLFLEAGDYVQCRLLQQELLNNYRDDFAHYDHQVKLHLLQLLYDELPHRVAQIFKYSHVAPDIQSRDLKPALIALIDAGLIHPVYFSQASGLPLEGLINMRRFKLLFLDLGLLNASNQLDPEVLLDQSFLQMNRGVLAEQFVGQELLAYASPRSPAKLFYWQREKPGSTSEIDFITHVGDQILPIEVKSGKTGRLKSLQRFLDEKPADLGVRISQAPLSLDGRILSVPLYLIHQLPRLISGNSR